MMIRNLKSPKRRDGHTIAPLKRGYPKTDYTSWGMVVQKQDGLGTVREVWLSNGYKVWNHAGRLDQWLERMRNIIPGHSILWGANIQAWDGLAGMDTEKMVWPDLQRKPIWLRDVFRWYPDRLDVIIRDVCGTDWDLSAHQAAFALALIGQEIVESLKAQDISLPVSGSHGAARLVRKHLSEPLPAPTHAQITWGQAAFFGGRFFSKFKGTIKGDFYKYDLIAAYARILRDLPGGEYIRQYGLDGNIDADDLSHNGIYRANVEILKPSLPVRTDRGVAYPVGETRGYWGGAELWAAKRAGLVEILSIPSGWCIEDNGNYPFREGVDYLQDRRDQAKGRAENRRWKMAINSIYGMLISAKGEWAGPFYNPFYAALVTSQVRAQVFKTFGNDYLIQQADAVWVDGRQDILWQGRWKLEALADTLVCFRASTYLVKQGLEYVFNQCRLHGFSGNKPEIISNLCRGVKIAQQTQHLKFSDVGFANSKHFFHNCEWGKPIPIKELANGKEVYR